MNHICRTIWNETTQSWVAASELAKGRSKSSSSAKKSLLKAGLLLGTLGAAFSSPAMAFTSTVTNQTVTGESLASGDHQTVTTGGIANNTVVNNGGAQVVENGGITNTTTLNGSGSQQTVGNNGTANGTIVNDGAWQWIDAGGTSNDTVIQSGGDQVVFAGGTAYGTIVLGGMQTVHGLAEGTQVHASGEQYIDQNGVANNTLVDGGMQDVFSGTANHTTVSGGGVQVVTFGTANHTTIYAGQQTLSGSAAQANDTVINAGGWQWVKGGTANRTTVNAGGEQVVMSGTANGTIINADGMQAVHGGAVANTTTIHTGGEQYVDAGATVNSTLINGGYQLLGGTANNTIANAGEIYAISGSMFTGTTQINGTAIIGGDLITNLGTLRFNPSSQTTVTTEIAGPGEVVKTGSGTLVLNNTHTYTGGTTVAGGRLNVGGSAVDSNAIIWGNVDVLNGGTLGGHGQIAGPVTVHNGGKMNPGSSIGTLTVGSAHFQSGSIFEVEVNPDGSNDKLIAKGTMGSGDVQIDSGSNLSLLGGAGAWNDSTTYNLIDTDSGVSGTFSNVSSNLAFLTPMVDYSNAKQVNLTLERNNTTFGAIGVSSNEKNTGFGIESLGPNNPIYQQILGMNAWQANNAYDNLSGEIHASTKSALLENSRFARHAVLDHLNDAPVQKTPEVNKNIWVSTWAHDGHLKNDGNAARLDNKGAGFLVGADLYDNGTTTIGAALGYEHTNLKAGSLRDSKAGVDAVHAIAYGKTQLGPIDLNGGVGYSHLKVDSERDVAVGSSASKNKAKYNAGLVQIFAEGSHTFEVNEQTRVTPYVGLTHQRLKADKFTEQGLYGQLQGAKGSDNMTSSTVGVRGQWDFAANSHLYANVGWQHSFGSQTPSSKLNFVAGQSYQVKGVQTNRDSALIGVGVNLALKPNMRLSVGYDGQFGNQSKDHGVKVGFEYKF